MPACATLVVALVAAINLAIPKLSASSLHPSPTELLWIVDTYVLVFGCLLIPAGALGDRYGRKSALLAGLAVLAAGALLSAAAPSVAVLLCGRALTGVGAGLVMPATLSLMVQSSPPQERPHAIAVWTAATGIAGVFGNICGGLVLSALPWQGLFLVVAPLAAVLAALSAFYVPPGERHPAELDLTGCALLTGAVAALLAGIIEGPAHGWTSPPVVGALVLAAALLALFTAYGLRAAHPLVDPRLFRLPGLRAGSLGVGVVFFGLFAVFYVNAQFLQYAKGYSALLTGVAVVPLAAVMVPVSRHSIGWSHRWGARRVVGAGLLITAGGLGLMSLAGAATPYALYALFLMVLACGMGLCVPSLSTAIMATLPRAQAGLGSGLNGATREIGSALGVAVFGTVLSSRFAGTLHTGHDQSPAGVLAAAAPAARPHVVGAFTAGMSLGYRVVGLIVLLLTPLILHWLRPAAGGAVP
jgi:EmrB/QacA subfamily drug resistance transporter